MSQIKKCYTCETDKAASEFNADRSRSDGLAYKCKTCKKEQRIATAARVKESSKKSYLKNRESRLEAVKTYKSTRKEQYRNTYLLRVYGITLLDEQRMFVEQGGVCKICKEMKTLHVDHCHKSGHVRGLLCTGCNKGLGLFRDNPMFLIEASKYVR